MKGLLFEEVVCKTRFLLKDKDKKWLGLLLKIVLKKFQIVSNL
jgi:hypothetical protein